MANHIRPAKSLAIVALTNAIETSKYDLPFDKAIEMIVALDRAGLKLIKKPLPHVDRTI